MPSIIVTDGEQRAALAVVRSLGRAGHRIIVTSTDGRSVAGASRHAARDVAVPHALREPAAFAAAIAHLVQESEAALVIPIAEPAALALLPHRQRLAPAQIPFPSLSSFERASDKVGITLAARRAGIRVPEQVVVETRADAAQLPAWTSTGAVLKPGRSVSQGQKLSVSYASPGTDVGNDIAQLPDAAFPLLIQRRIVGPGTGVFLLRWNGGTLAAFAHRRVREKPPSGGVSVVRESVLLDADLQARSEALLEELEWQGVAMLEFKRDARDGTPYLMEINGRFWGSLQLAIDSGVDFPELLIAAALDGRTDAAPAYEVGVRSRWLLGDLDHLLARLRRSRTELNLPDGAPGRTMVALSFVRDFLPPNRLEVLRIGDMAPFRRELRLWLRRTR